VGPSKDAGCTTENGDCAGGVMYPRQAGLTMWTCGAEGGGAAFPCGRGSTRVGIAVASARVDATAAAGTKVRDIDARRSGCVMVRGEGERGKQGEVWVWTRAAVRS
jgi:hypothetical protein